MNVVVVGKIINFPMAFCDGHSQPSKQQKKATLILM